MEKTLFWSLFVTSMILTSGEELSMKNFIVDIKDNILRSVRTIEKTSNELNLSGLGLRDIDKNAFDNVSELKVLTIANNSLTHLPEFVFINLTNLEHLSLADNEISKFDNNFVGLNNLRTLNISNNPIKILKKGYMYGLTNNSEIFTLGTSFLAITSGLFENPFLRDRETPKQIREKIKSTRLENEETNENLTSIKICIERENLSLLEILTEKDEILSKNCRQLKINLTVDELNLRNLQISGFEKNWYNLQASSITSLDLSHNKITKITSELLNELPKNIKMINLSSNNIERLSNGIIDNDGITNLDLSKNSIIKIDDNALRRTNLVKLHLSDNKLKSTKFIATLPTTTNFIDLKSNRIDEISTNSFANFNEIKKLILNDNRIARLSKRSLTKLSSLEMLDLSDNRIARLRSGCFDDLKALKILNLHNNSIDVINENVFNGLKSLEVLNIGKNKLTEITNELTTSLPKSLQRLRIDHNYITSLQARTFVDVPRDTLSLNGNKISNIDNGTFYLPNLTTLRLDDNALAELNGEAFSGLANLKYLILQSNGIKKITKGFASQLGNLESLNLSKNPIVKLENGALFGIPKWSDCSIYLVDVPLEIIQGGLFDNV